MSVYIDTQFQLGSYFIQVIRNTKPPIADLIEERIMINAEIEAYREDARKSSQADNVSANIIDPVEGVITGPNTSYQLPTEED